MPEDTTHMRPSHGQHALDTSSFLELLSQYGYFEGAAVTSELFSKRRAHAARQFEYSQQYSAGAPMSEDSLVRRAAQALDAITTDLGWQPPAAGNDASSDDDSWLALDADELDTVMRKAEAVLQDASQGDPELMPGDGEDDQTAQDLQSMLAKFEAFLAADSGIEGANLMDAQSDDEYAESSDDDVDLDADGIINALMETLGVEGLTQSSKTTGVHDPSSSASNKAQEAESVSNDTPVNPSKDDSKTALSSIMSAMDHELSGTSVGKSFFRHDQAEPAQEDDDLEYELDDVNVDLNLVQNIVESFQAQEGLPGPAGTMLGQAGIHLPHSGGASGSNANSDGADM